MCDNAVERLFSMFASSDRAVAMAGDLAEEREQHGWIWFWLQVLGTTLALWRHSATEAPLRVLALTMAGCAIFAAPAFGGTAAVFLFPQKIEVSWIVLPFLWWGGALFTGASLVAIAPRRGMAACATLAVTAQTLLMSVGVVAVRHELLDGYPLLFFTTGLLAVAPLLAGGAIARRQMLALELPTMEQHR